VPDDLERTSDELVGAFLRMAGVQLSEETVQTSLDLVCLLAQETIHGTVGAGVTLIRDGKKWTAAYSDGEVVKQADDLQYELDEGPCLSAYRDQRPYRIDSMRAETRWPRWTPAAAALGLGSYISTPLLVPGGALGAIKIYSRRENEYDDRAQRILVLLSEQAAVLLANVVEYSGAKEMTEQLKEALETRDTIGMAKGILMLQEGIGEEAAFDMLRQASQNGNVKLREIARGLVDRTVRREQS
jgi:GAF domain-containing protein